jgi:hypothetical protein
MSSDVCCGAGGAALLAPLFLPPPLPPRFAAATALSSTPSSKKSFCFHFAVTFFTHFLSAELTVANIARVLAKFIEKRSHNFFPSCPDVFVKWRRRASMA